MIFDRNKNRLVIALLGLLLIMTTACGLMEETETEGEDMVYDFSRLTNIRITGVDLSELSREELAVLYCWAEYNQAMTDADIDTLRRLVPEDMTFRHMSGRTQTREEYFADIADGSLNYITTELKNPVITVDGDHAVITCTTVLTANAYGASGSWPFTGTRSFEKRGGAWMLAND